MSKDEKEKAPLSQGPQRMADLLRKAVSQAREKPAPGLAQLESTWKQREVDQRKAEAAERAQHEATQVAAWPEHLRRCHAPAEAVEALSGDKVLNTPALHAARHVIQEGVRTLLLSGGVGVGKTTGACHLFRLALRCETRAGQLLHEWDADEGFFVPFAQLKLVSDDGTEAGPLLRRARMVRVLVVDALDGRSGEDLGLHHRELLEELVGCRDKPGMVTAFTTNLSVQRREGSPSDFAAHVGARVVARMSRQGTFHLADCGMRDLRQRGTS
ncbi:hypothetical protein [Myxococcus landrumensis]|uniref:IstB-like ATP-binding protein domain-containing protein n=1 Tax=Myxococcus landrumensis TaxID=2813577 RepID=A0ABX7ND43_9BACT|nr:hypothetical protein [Myxococcus landrumus]QSQ15331.1 hypothetical protein JY572_04395 [Myxococcus landrumus]